MSTPLWVWATTFGVVGAVIGLDLFVFHRRAKPLRPRDAAAWSAVWIGLAIAFGGIVWAWRGEDAAGRYFAGYLLEKALAVDNLFVFAVLLAAFAVPHHLQHRLLTWGVLGALCSRAALIAAGVGLIDRFRWALVVLGPVVVLSGTHLLRAPGRAVAPGSNRTVRLMGRLLRTTDGYVGSRLVVRKGSRVVATPLLGALVAIETADLLFAMDSIPAVLGVTTDAFLVVMSNAFAVLGLRSLYFVLVGAAARIRYLRLGLAAVLLFIGGKMTLSHLLHVSVAMSLAVIIALIGAAVAASLVADRVGNDAPGS